jgi:putative ABC transport system ATP-binding protein
VVTHDPEVADAAQRTIVLEHGKVAREVINEHFDEQQKLWLARLNAENKG